MTNLCENVLFLEILSFFNIAVTIMRFLVPIILILKLSLDIYHQIIDVNEKEGRDRIIKRSTAAIIVFLVPVFVNILLTFMEGISGMSFNYSECSANATRENIKGIIEKQDKENQKNEELINVSNTMKYNENIDERNKQAIALAKQGLADPSAIFIGQKYNLTEEELKGLCGVAKSEQGTIEGSKLEASLMANRYELLGTNSKHYGKGLFNYVKNSGWFANASKHIEEGQNGSCTDERLQAVRDVLVNGNRTLPLYGNEHDCFNCNYNKRCYNNTGNIGDICFVNNGVKDITKMDDLVSRSDEYFIPNVTKIYTVYKMNDSVKYWVFLKFANKYDENGNLVKDSNGNIVKVGDPFGYTEDAYNRINSLGR